MISKRAITGLDVTVLIACGGRGKMVTTLELAESTGLSVSNLEQILKQLKNHQIIKSIKGPGGGYQLSADLEQLTVLDLVRIFDKSSNHSKLNPESKSHPPLNEDSSEIAGDSTIAGGEGCDGLLIDASSVEASFIALIEEFLGAQKLIDLVSLLPQWSKVESTPVSTGRFKLKDPPPRIVPRSPNSVFQLSAFMSQHAYG